MPESARSSEDKLLERARQGDERAFRQLVERYEGLVAATVIGMLGPGPDAEDVGQETFIRFNRALKSFRGDSSVGTYLTRIAINQSPEGSGEEEAMDGAIHQPRPDGSAVRSGVDRPRGQRRSGEPGISGCSAEGHSGAFSKSPGRGRAQDDRRLFDARHRRDPGNPPGNGAVATVPGDGQLKVLLTLHVEDYERQGS